MSMRALHHILEGKSEHFLSNSFSDSYNSRGKKDLTFETNQPFGCVECCSSQTATKGKIAKTYMIIRLISQTVQQAEGHL